MALVTTKDPDAVLAEAEAIARAGQPNGNSAGDPTRMHTPADGAGASARPPADAPPSPDSLTLGRLCVTFTDLVFVRYFGPEAAMQEPLAGEAVTAWARVIEKYVPMIQAAGPWAALFGCYLAHATVCASKPLWMSAPLPAPSDGEAAARPLS